VENSKYDAILFDFDGVLADTEPVHWQCWVEIIQPFGIDLPWEVYSRKCIGVSDRKMIEALASEARTPVDPELLWGQYDEKKRRFRERIIPAKPVSEAAIELVRALCDYKLALVTSSGRSEVEPVLEAAGIRDCFQAAVFGGDVARLKPAPDPYLKAAGLLGTSRPLVIEDSDAGCESAIAAGFDFLRIPAADEMPALVRRHLALP
jgi:HAD superfamily hydrolase (TIGR01509 family)